MNYKTRLKEEWDKESALWDIASSVRPLVTEFWLSKFDELEQKIEGMKWQRNFPKDGAGVMVTDIVNKRLDDVISLIKE